MSVSKDAIRARDHVIKRPRATDEHSAMADQTNCARRPLPEALLIFDTLGIRFVVENLPPGISCIIASYLGPNSHDRHFLILPSTSFYVRYGILYEPRIIAILNRDHQASWNYRSSSKRQRAHLRSQWQYLERGHLWGDCFPKLNVWLERHYENKTPAVWEKSHALQWRYDFEEMKQFREERKSEAAEWTVTSITWREAIASLTSSKR